MTDATDNRLPATLLRVLALLALCSALFWLGWTALMWWRWHPQLPWRDLFVILGDLRPLLNGGGAGDWLDFLLQPHYAAHRIAIPRLLVALDLEYFGAHNQLLYVTAWGSLLATWCLLLRVFATEPARSKSLLVFYAGIVGLLLFAPAHLWNLSNGINSAWHLSLLFAVLALALLGGARGAPSPGRWLAAYGLATLAALTTFSGVILWLLLPLFALASSRRDLVFTMLASTVLVGLYLQGIASDAAVATQWQTGGDEAVAQMRETGRAALAANTPLRILEKAALVLAWPLAAQQPGLGTSLVALSLLLPLAAAWSALGRLRAGSGLPPAWITFCLLLAALTAGTAVAIQLGRVVEQPNYAHGPSYERYATIAALYWCSVAGLLLDGLRRRSGTQQLLAMVGTLAIAWLLIAPRGDYLQQELDSLQTAGRLYAVGESPELRGASGASPSRFKPNFVYSFDDLFSPREAAYRRAAQLPGGYGGLPLCADMGVTLTASPLQRPGRLRLRATVAGPRHYLVRDLLLSSGGRLLARLVPRYRGEGVAWALLARGDTLWQGRADLGETVPLAPQLSFTMPAGLSTSCRLHPWDLAPLQGADGENH